MPSSQTRKELSISNFLSRASSITSFSELQSLRGDSLSTENLYRELFARQRDSWEIPEIDDPHHFLVDVYAHPEKFTRLATFPDDDIPRCFSTDDDDDDGGDDGSRSTIPSPGQPVILPTRSDFLLSWDCLTEGLLRFLNWDNVLCAGGSVSGCLSPLPPSIASLKGASATRLSRRKYYHDRFLPSSDIDIFLHGLDESQAAAKLIEIYDAIQAANPFEIRVFRSSHAVTLVSRYPFRHVQIVLRLYSSPSEILMGFDVDACAVGYDGRRVWACPRAMLAMMSGGNVVDVTRRSPSYEMRLAKYARRGFEVMVPGLRRERIDPFLYEKRFDQTKGLTRLLMLEKLRTPEERFRHRIEGQLKNKFHHQNHLEWMIRNKIRKVAGDLRNLDRMEGTCDGIQPTSGVEVSDYSTVFLPWGPEWTAERIERVMKKKDKILNKVEFLPNGRVVKCRRNYKIHVCAVGTMEEIIADPFPDDPPFPSSLPPSALESTVHGKLTWLVDNPGRQQIGSFHPITSDDWTDGAYISTATEELVTAAISDDAPAVAKILEESSDDASSLLSARDFLGRTVLHVAALASAERACRVIVDKMKGSVGGELLDARLADGRNVLHLAAMRGDVGIATLILEKRDELAASAVTAAEATTEETTGDGTANTTALATAATDILDVDAADWEIKLSPLQYAVSLGHVSILRTLLSHGANPRKIAVHKDFDKSLSTLSLLALYASECGRGGSSAIEPMARLLFGAGAAPGQVDTSGFTCWHRLASYDGESCREALRIMLRVAEDESDAKVVRGLDILDRQQRTALYVATVCGNADAVGMLLAAGATMCFSERDWDERLRRLRESGGEGAMRMRYYGGGDSGGVTPEGEMKRHPFIWAVKNADGDCLKKYLSHDPSLANSVIRIVLLQKKSEQYYQSPTMLPTRPLNCLENLKDVLMEQQNNSKDAKSSPHYGNITRLTSQITTARLKIDRSRQHMTSFQKSSYEHFAWSLVVKREEDSLSQLQSQLEQQQSMMDNEEDDDDKNEEDMLRIEEAMTILTAAGGVSTPSFGLPATTTTTTNAPHHSPPEPASSLADPTTSHSELPPAAVPTPGRYYHNRHHRIPFPPHESSTSRRFMIAAADGDVDVLRRLSTGGPAGGTRVCFGDGVDVSPLFLAVRNGHVEAAREVHDAARRQFRVHVERILAARKEDVDGEEDKTKQRQGGDADDDLVKDQIRRLNNLDLAADDDNRTGAVTTTNQNRSPDTMRQALERAERTAARLDNVSRESLVSCQVSPEALLVHRSIVVADRDPRVKELRERLRRTQPHSFSEAWVNFPARVNPLELAVLKGDRDMVEMIISLAMKVQGCVDNECESEVDDDDDEDSSRGEDYDSDDDDEYDEQPATSHNNAPKPPSSLSPSQIRYLLVGNGSTNQDWGNMTLLQLAIAVDDLAVFHAVASYAREYALPIGAVLRWKQQVETAADGKEDEETKLARRKENAIIAGTNEQRYGQVNVPTWAPRNDGASSSPPYYHHQSNGLRPDVHPTSLQFALSISSPRVTKALLSGVSDDSLLGWITSSSNDVGTTTTARKRDMICGNCASLVAASWLARHVASLRQNDNDGGDDTTTDTSIRFALAMRLVRPTAVDGYDRTALFYTPTDERLFSMVIDSAIEAMARGCKNTATTTTTPDNLKEIFLDQSCAGGITALMAAAGAGQDQRVTALLALGCHRTTTTGGSKNWGSVHMAIPEKINRGGNAVRHRHISRRSPTATEATIDVHAKRWKEARGVITALLEGASESETAELLLSPSSEHNPLMLAVDRGGDAETIDLLSKRTSIVSTKGLTCRDGDLNTLLHIAVKDALSQIGNNDNNNKNKKPDLDAIIKYLLETPNVAGPNVENARGVTPLEMTLQSIVSLWNRMSPEHRMNSQRINTNHRSKLRLAVGRQQHHRSTDDSNNNNKSEEWMGRKILSLLEETSSSTEQRGLGRCCVGFDDVANAAKQRLAQRSGNDDGEMQVDEPRGPPLVLPLYGHTQRGQLVSWNGW